MPPRCDVPAEILARAADRSGVVSRRELLAAGLTPTVVARMTRAWRRLLPGVYCLDLRPEAPEDSISFAQRAQAGVVLAGGGAVVGGMAAACLLGLVDDPPAVIDIVLPRRRRPAPQPGYRFVRVRPGVHATPLPRDLPTLRIEDVVLDLAATAPRDRAIGLVATACQRRLTHPCRLADRLAARTRHPRRALLQGLLADVASGSISYLEVGYLRRVERAHRLPASVRQVVVPATGHRSDGAYPDSRVLLELDGTAFHSGAQRLRDAELDAAHLVEGWTTIRITYPMVFDQACATARRVMAVHRARGGQGALGRCPECPPAGPVQVAGQI